MSSSSIKFYNLAGSPDKSCNVIHFRDILIMFDCTLDFMSTLAYLPLSLIHNDQLSSLPNWLPPKDRLKQAQFTPKETRLVQYEVKECQSGIHCIDSSPEFSLFDTKKLDVTRIDIVLISNYLNMFGLPYLTERLGFKGDIYVTEPTYHFGKILMEEVIRFIERTPKPGRQQLWKRIYDQVNMSIPRNHSMNRDPKTWLPIYTSKELSSCLSKLKMVNFSQTIDVFGLFEVTAHSSGFCIGSCNWTLKSNHEKIVYMSQTSLLTTHPKPFEAQPLQEADILVLTNLTSSPLVNPDTMLGEFCSHTIQALKKEGSVLIPCYPCGMVYDLIECIAGQLTAANLTTVPIYFISPVAEASLAYANILGEWLTSSKGSKVFIPDEPFIHSSLVRAGRLKHFSSVSDPRFNEHFKSPCVVFTSHPSLRFGDVVHFIQLWGRSNKNLMIFTEPDFPCHEAISPYLPLAMRILNVPIDTNWNFKQANQMLNNDLRPNSLILHNSYAMKPKTNFVAHGFSSTDLMIELHDSVKEDSTTSDVVATSSNSVVKYKPRSTAMLPYDCLETIEYNSTKAIFERVKIDCDFAKQIVQSEIRPGISFATISGCLRARDNKFFLYSPDDPITREAFKGHPELPTSYYYGNLDLQLLKRQLEQRGFTDAIVEGTKSGKMIQLRSLQAIMHAEDHQTTIISNDANARLFLSTLVQSCLKRF